MTSLEKHPVVTHEEWVAARKALLEKEKEFSQFSDDLARQRRELPWTKVEKKYEFHTPQGQQSLADLFGSHSQLFVYHFMFGPGWKEGCVNCSYLMDHVDGALPHLYARDVSFVAISRAPLAEIEPFKKRMQWRFPWVSSHGSDFNFDYHVSFSKEELAKGEATYNFEVGPVSIEELPGASIFYKDRAGNIFHTYSAYARGLDHLLGTYQYLDLTPKGRDEDNLKFSMAWVRYHDRYGSDYAVDTQAMYAPPEGAASAESKP